MPFNGLHWSETYDPKTDSYSYQAPFGVIPIQSSSGAGGRFSSGSSAKDDFMSWLKPVLDSVQSAQQAYQTSAIAEAKRQAAELNEFNRIEAQKERDWSSAEAAKARDWQAKREDSAYQRLVTDLRSAGLNPILAYQSANPQTGSAAQASSGAAARGVQANISSAKNADKIDLEDLLPIMIVPLLSSALSAINKIADNGISLF